MSLDVLPHRAYVPYWNEHVPVRVKPSPNMMHDGDRQGPRRWNSYFDKSGSKAIEMMTK
jgi:hypothetical protein